MALMTRRILTKGTKVVLPYEEYSWCRAWAKAVQHINNQTGIKDQKRSRRGSVDIMIDGKAAECAFCQLIGVEPDESMEPRSRRRGEDWGDVRLPNGRTIEVKSAPHHESPLMTFACLAPHYRCDYFVLMTGGRQEWIFQGLTSRKAFLDDPSHLMGPEQNPLLVEMSYVMRQDELKDCTAG